MPKNSKKKLIRNLFIIERLLIASTTSSYGISEKWETQNVSFSNVKIIHRTGSCSSDGAW